MSRGSAKLAAPLASVMLLTVAACSPKHFAVNQLGNALAGGGGVYATEDDPELVAQSIPFGLKTMEALLQESPKHRGLLLAASSGFTQYSYAFVESEADYVEDADLSRATAMRARALKLYHRGMEYGFRGLEVNHPGFRKGLHTDLDKTLATATKDDVGFLYWTAAAWAAQASMAKLDASISADLPIAAAMMKRADALSPGFGDGAVSDFFISYDAGRPAAAGGSIDKARVDLAKSLELAKGHRAAPYASFAEGACVSLQDKKEFTRLLNLALAVDVDKVPDQRLANLISQKRARWLLAHTDSLFIE